MTNINLPAVSVLKDQAKRLRTSLAAEGAVIGHSKSLEMLAKQYGYRDWNTLHAASGNRPATFSFALGQHVEGLYLGKPFTGQVHAIRSVGADGWHRVTINFDGPVEVAGIEGMPVTRSRVSATLGPNGRTVEKTSNGQPHMVIH